MLRELLEHHPHNLLNLSRGGLHRPLTCSCTRILNPYQLDRRINRCRGRESFQTLLILRSQRLNETLVQNPRVLSQATAQRHAAKRLESTQRRLFTLADGQRLVDLNIQPCRHTSVRVTDSHNLIDTADRRQRCLERKRLRIQQDSGIETRPTRQNRRQIQRSADPHGSRRPHNSRGQSRKLLRRRIAHLQQSTHVPRTHTVISNRGFPTTRKSLPHPRRTLLNVLGIRALKFGTDLLQIPRILQRKIVIARNHRFQNRLPPRKLKFRRQRVSLHMTLSEIIQKLAEPLLTHRLHQKRALRDRIQIRLLLLQQRQTFLQRVGRQRIQPNLILRKHGLQLIQARRNRPERLQHTLQTSRNRRVASIRCEFLPLNPLLTHLGQRRMQIIDVHARANILFSDATQTRTRHRGHLDAAITSPLSRGRSRDQIINRLVENIRLKQIQATANSNQKPQRIAPLRERLNRLDAGRRRRLFKSSTQLRNRLGKLADQLNRGLSLTLVPQTRAIPRALNRLLSETTQLSNPLQLLNHSPAVRHHIQNRALQTHRGRRSIVLRGQTCKLLHSLQRRSTPTRTHRMQRTNMLDQLATTRSRYGIVRRGVRLPRTLVTQNRVHQTLTQRLWIGVPVKLQKQRLKVHVREHRRDLLHRGLTLSHDEHALAVRSQTRSRVHCKIDAIRSRRRADRNRLALRHRVQNRISIVINIGQQKLVRRIAVIGAQRLDVIQQGRRNLNLCRLLSGALSAFLRRGDVLARIVFCRLITDGWSGRGLVVSGILALSRGRLLIIRLLNIQLGLIRTRDVRDLRRQVIRRTRVFINRRELIEQRGDDRVVHRNNRRVYRIARSREGRNAHPVLNNDGRASFRSDVTQNSDRTRGVEASRHVAGLQQVLRPHIDTIRALQEAKQRFIRSSAPHQLQLFIINALAALQRNTAQHQRRGVILSAPRTQGTPRHQTSREIAHINAARLRDLTHARSHRTSRATRVLVLNRVTQKRRQTSATPR